MSDSSYRDVFRNHMAVIDRDGGQSQRDNLLLDGKCGQAVVVGLRAVNEEALRQVVELKDKIVRLEAEAYQEMYEGAAY